MARYAGGRHSTRQDPSLQRSTKPPSGLAIPGLHCKIQLCGIVRKGARNGFALALCFQQCLQARKHHSPVLLGVLA
jgi:hypothetical protein